MSLKAFMWKVQRWLFGRWLGMLFYQKRIDRDGNIVSPKIFFGALSQRWTEAGFSLPWAMTKEECWKFWSTVTNSREFCGNRPAYYATKEKGIIEFLHNFWSPQISPEKHILELGCNCGRNLNRLYELGYRNLSGWEINANAIEEMKRSFPGLIKRAAISLGSMEELFSRTPSKSVDAIFTTAVLLHIHPANNFVFSEMARIVKNWIIIVEHETVNHRHIFPRNYLRVFQRLDCPQLKSAVLTRNSFPCVGEDLYGYTARMFSLGRSRV